MINFLLNLFESGYLNIKILVFLHSIYATLTNPIFIVMCIIIYLFFYSISLNKMFLVGSKDINYKVKKFKVEKFSIIKYLKENKDIIIKNSIYSAIYTFLLFSVIFILVMNQKISQTNYEKLKTYIQSNFKKEILIDIDNPWLVLFFNQKNMFLEPINNPKKKQLIKKIIKKELKDKIITHQELFLIITISHLSKSSHSN